MNNDEEPVHIGQEDDIDVGSVENFEHEEIDYAIFRLESGFFALQGHCHCEDQTFIVNPVLREKSLNVLVVATRSVSYQVIQ